MVQEAVGDATRAISASVVERIMKRLRSVVPMVIASVQISAMVPLVDYVASPGAAEAVLYSPDTKVPRTGEVALRRAIPANSNMKSIQVCSVLLACLVDFFFFFFLCVKEIVIAFFSFLKLIWKRQILHLLAKMLLMFILIFHISCKKHYIS